MTKRIPFSDNYSLYTRKYFLGVVFVLGGLLLIVYGAKWIKVFGVLFVAVGVFYLLLRKVEFDDEYIYIGNKRYRFEQVTKMGGIDINMYLFPCLVINDNGRIRRIYTDAGQAGILRILIGIIFPALDPHKNIKHFMELFKASR
jgi:hypothetical protein